MDDTKPAWWVANKHIFTVAAGLLMLAGCNPEPDFRAYRLEGQRLMVKGNHGVARGLFEKAHEMVPEDPINLHDMADCSLYYARDLFARGDTVAAFREVDKGIEYYQRAINAHPGFPAALLGKNIALELKGQFEEALKVVEWAVRFVGPSAQQQIFLAQEMEERGDMDAALLRLRQAVAMEKENAAAHEALGKFSLRMGDHELAIRHLTRAYSLDPNRPGLADTLAGLGVAVNQLTPIGER